MADPVNRIPGVQSQRIEIDPVKLRTAEPAAPAGTKSFKEILGETIGEVQRLQDEADSAVKKLVAGEVKDVTDAMVAVEKADIAFQTMMVVRNKMVAAYEEIMRMNV
ncbi:MAG: flagellar hook-basal body complex protein FliE [Candidatus Hydrogenedentes bacterium]|nr:flagellar hook-basal body complex protein FliE [Candidatus Hydrogenedentota bacterium]